MVAIQYRHECSFQYFSVPPIIFILMFLIISPIWDKIFGETGNWSVLYRKVIVKKCHRFGRTALYSTILVQKILWTWIVKGSAVQSISWKTQYQPCLISESIFRTWGETGSETLSDTGFHTDLCYNSVVLICREGVCVCVWWGVGWGRTGLLVSYYLVTFFGNFLGDSTDPISDWRCTECRSHSCLW